MEYLRGKSFISKKVPEKRSPETVRRGGGNSRRSYSAQRKPFAHVRSPKINPYGPEPSGIGRTGGERPDSGRQCGARFVLFLTSCEYVKDSVSPTHAGISRSSQIKRGCCPLGSPPAEVWKPGWQQTGGKEACGGAGTPRQESCRVRTCRGLRGDTLWGFPPRPAH